MVNQMIRTKFGFLLLLTFIFMVAGCSNTDSENIDTAGIHADIRVKSTDSSSTEVRVDLSVGSGGVFDTGLELSGEDTLTATDGSTTKTLVKDNFLGDIEYKTTFATAAADTKFTVSFIRSNGDSAENSFVTMPAPFTFSTTASSVLSGNTNTPVPLNWTQTNQPKTIVVDCLCSISTAGGTQYTSFLNTIPGVVDDGTELYTIGQLVDEPDLRTYENCDITITMSRTNTGEIDSGFGEGGTITATQSREINIDFSPTH